MPRASCPACAKEFDTVVNPRGEMRCPFCGGLARLATSGGSPKPKSTEHVPESKRCFSCEGVVFYHAKKCPHCGQVFGGRDVQNTSDALPDANPRDLLLSSAFVALGFACAVGGLSKTWMLFVPAAGLFYGAFRINRRGKGSA